MFSTDDPGPMAVILDHYQHPRNHGRLEAPDLVCEDVNPGCGDRLRFEVRFGEENRIEAVRFVGDGCTISVAGASVLTTLVAGRPLEQAVRLSESTLLEALGFAASPRRLDCALLGVRTLRAGLIRYYHEHRLRDHEG